MSSPSSPDEAKKFAFHKILRGLRMMVMDSCTRCQRVGDSFLLSQPWIRHWHLCTFLICWINERASKFVSVYDPSTSSPYDAVQNASFSPSLGFLVAMIEWASSMEKNQSTWRNFAPSSSAAVRDVEYLSLLKKLLWYNKMITENSGRHALGGNQVYCNYCTYTHSLSTETVSTQ